MGMLYKKLSLLITRMKLYYTTFPNDEERERISNILIDEQLAGCVVSVPVSSLYMWDGEKTEEDEVAALFKTSESKAGDTVSRLNEEHPYDTPCILEIPVAANKAYDLWLHQVTDGIVDRSNDADETVLVRFDIGPIFRVPADLNVIEAASRLHTPEISGELQDLLIGIIDMREEFGPAEDVYPLAVNGEQATLYAPLSAFDEEPVHITLR